MAALVHGVIIVGVTFGGRKTKAGAPGLEGADRLRRRARSARNETAAYLAQRTQLGSGNNVDPREARSPRAAAEHAARNGRADGTVLPTRPARCSPPPTARANYHGADARDPVLRAAGQPHGDDRGPVQTEGNSDRDKMGVDDDEEQKRVARSATSCGSRPTPRGAGGALPGRLAYQDRAPGHHEFPAGRLARTGNAQSDVEVVILADGTLESATIVRSSGSASSTRPRRHPETGQSVRSVPQGTGRSYRLLRFTYGWEFDGARRSAR